jgi:DNA-binding response OmpR family regulator
MRILIADDDSTSRLLLKSILKKWGYEVVEAKDGLEAYKIICSENTPQIVILDWMMPEINGPDLCRKITKELKREQFYLILLTAKDKTHDLIAGLEAGADDYIAKPWKNEELQVRLKVGIRMLNLLSQASKKQKLQGILEMAGAVCHELNQPLQVVMGYSDLLLEEIDENDSRREALEEIVKSVNKMGELTHKIMNITDESTLTYLEGCLNIVDIHNTSKKKSD